MAPKRELPSLHIKIVADPSSALKGIESIIEAAVKGSKRISKAVKEQVDNAEKEFLREFHNYRLLQKSKEIQHKETQRRMKKIDDAARKEREAADKASAERRKQIEKETVDFFKKQSKRQAAFENSDGNKNYGRLTGFGRAVRSAAAKNKPASGFSLNDLVKNAETNAKQTAMAVERQKSAMASANTKLAKQVRDGALIQQDAIAQRKKAVEDEADVMAKANKERMRQVEQSRKAIKQQADEQDKEEARALRRQRMRQVRRLKAQKAVGSFGARVSRGFKNMDAGNMMGARADVYMHRQALDSIGRGIVNFMQPYAEVEQATISMKVFTGSLKTAKETVAELHQYAIESPYSLPGVLQASQLLMKYGASAKEAVQYTKMLGDVAGGDSDKLKLLGLALGQMKGIGTVQGQEVRQMVNAGFNPLQVAAKEMAGPGASEEDIAKKMQVLMDAMRRRQLDWKLVVAALKVATSQGGAFAGMADEQSKTVMGLTNQIMETIGLLKVEVAKVFEEDLKKLLRTVLQYATALVGWVKANAELVKSYVYMGIEILKMIVVLHMVGFAFAWLKWMVGTVAMIFGALSAVFRVTVMVLTGVRSALLFLFPVLNSLRLSFIGTWIAALGPIAWVIAAVMFLYVILAGLTHEGGFAGLVGDWIKALFGFIGFFYNFSHNINNMWSFMMKNMVLILIDGVLQIMSQFIMLGKLAAQVVDSIAGTKLRASIDSTIEGIRGMAGTGGKYDMSMLKFNMPNMDDMMAATGIKDALKPYMPEDKPYVIPEKPDVDFNSFIKGGGPGTGAPAPDHVISGSSEHAVRMYKYGEAARAEAEGGGPESHEDKMEDLLGRIERNTRSSTNPNSMIEEAALV